MEKYLCLNRSIDVHYILFIDNTSCKIQIMKYRKFKKKALSEIVNLITLIHNIIDYQDQDNILELYNPLVLVTEQNKDLQILQDKNGKSQKLECIATMVSKTYYEYINNSSQNIDLLAKRTRVITIRILMNLYVEIKNGRINGDTDVRKMRTALFLNADLCKGLNL
jgi:hypothetical protein